ncbi:hypothetical protein MMC28_010742 [Mycoblastus sanguinarius]|nr:hypothetical protein [Mycoblastus sanguinarius]
MSLLQPKTTEFSEVMEPLECLSIQEDPKNLLRKTLSPRFIMSGRSLFVRQYHESSRANARRKQNVNETEPLQILRAIGWGSCGVIYHQLGTTHVVKQAINNNMALSEDCRLWNDLIMHKTVEEAFARVKWVDTLVQVPRCYRYIDKTETAWWTAHESLFPEGQRISENLLLTEHIAPINLVARDALIDQYCPEGLRAAAKLQTGNDDCLVRLYLGKRRDSTSRQKSPSMFGLRNFQLCLDQMQGLGLDTETFAFAMAEALAVMHWEAKIDAADVEFVLGGAPCLTHDPLPMLRELQCLQDNSSTSLGTLGLEAAVTHIWLLDFNQCQPISMDDIGITQAVKRFFVNDPYYPRPLAPEGSYDEKLWQAFEGRYLEISGRLVRSEHRALPLLFIEKVAEEMLARNRRKAEAAKQSDKFSEVERAGHSA